MRWAWLLLGWPTLAFGDLQADGREWNDLGRWLDGLRAAGGEIRAGDPVNLSAIPAGSGLALLAPGAIEDPEGVRRFVREGGRLLIAVEGPENDALLRVFDTRAVDAPPDPSAGHPALTVLATPDARVFSGVGAMVINRPAGLAPMRTLDAALRFADGTPFAYHLEVGEGQLLLMGDASAFIDLMLDAGGNARFGANVLAWLSRAGTVPVTVVGGGIPLEGEHGADPESASGLDGINQSLAGLAGTQAPGALLVHLLLALLLAAATAYTLMVFPGRAGRRVGPARPSTRSGPVERAAGAPGGPAAPEAPSSEPT